MLTNEQAEQIKKQIIEQIKTNFPENKKEFAISQLNSMNKEQLQEFIVQNKLIKNIDQNQPCIFCKIIAGEISSYKIDENEESIAILELNPISKSHTIIIPKIHSENMPKNAIDLAKQIAKKISENFKPKKVEIVESILFNHKIINVFPIFNNENLHSQRHQANQQELEKIQKILTKSKLKEKKLPKLKKPKILTEKNTWLPKRFP